MKKAMLIDGNSIMNRAFYGTQSSNMRNADGQFTGALFGFWNILMKNLDDIEPDYIAVAFDKKSPTFRHKLYSEYKGTRHAMPEELASQMPLAKEMLDCLGIDRLEIEGYEADDILGTLSLQAEKNDIKAYILTGDRDSFQLISEKVNIKYFTSKSGKSETVNYDEEMIREVYGLTPSALIEVKALMGDSSDNVPGVPGVGEKTAIDLIQKYGNLDNVYENLQNITKKALLANLTNGRESAFLSKTLVTIDRFVPDINISQHERKEIHTEELVSLLRKLEFKTFLNRFDKMINTKEEASVAAAQLTEEIKCTKVWINSGNYTDTAHIFLEINKKAAKLKLMSIDYVISEDKLQKVSICFDKDTIYIFDFRKNSEEEKQPDLFTLFDVPDNNSSSDMLKEFISGFYEILNDNDIKKIMFDAKPFVKFCKQNGCEIKGLAHDVKIAAYLSDSLRRTDYISDAYRYYLGKDIPENSEYDCGYMLDLPEAIDNKLEKEGMLYLYRFVEIPLIEVLTDMETTGFRIKPEVLKAEGEKFNRRIEEVEEKIYETAGCRFNINSPKQLGEILFDKLKIAKGQKSKTGSYKTGAEVLTELQDKHEIVPMILEYRQNKKLMSTYIDGLLQVVDKQTGKIHSTFNQTVTATGRLSSTEPNLQNIPVRHEIGSKIRTAFVPSEEGRVLVDADYSQIELRIMAHLSGDKNMIDTFKAGGDIHTMTAAKVNGINPSEVTGEMRTKAKAVNFGIIYGISDFGLSRDLGISFYAAKKYIEDYFIMYPAVKEYLDNSVMFAKKNGFAVTAMGRRRYLPELSSSKYMERQFGERVAMNMPIQGTAADIIKFAMVKVYERLKKEVPDAKIILQVHDELLLDVSSDNEEKVKNILRECMENVMSISVPLPVSVTSGATWGAAK